MKILIKYQIDFLTVMCSVLRAVLSWMFHCVPFERCPKKTQVPPSICKYIKTHGMGTCSSGTPYL